MLLRPSTDPVEGPKSLVFHLITSTELAPVVSRALITVLPVLGAQLQVHSDALVQKRIKSTSAEKKTGLISYRSSSGARKGLASAFNFAPFYLEDFLRDGGLPKRLIYLDTDVLLLGDIEALWKVDMKGLPAAAVEDCSQSFDIYIDFDEMEALGLKKTGLSKKDCVFNRGIFVMDVAKWKRMQITKEIEHWMAKYKESKKDLYKFGMSQPPWLLALHKKYHKLGEEWNCRGLGRETLSLKELKELKTELHLDFKALQKVGARAMGDQAQPYIASCSREAQILHFNGKLKPWRSHRWVRKKPAPMCMVHGKTFPTLEKKSVLDMSFVRCADIWSNFLSMPAAELLNSTAQQFYRFQCGRNGSSDGGVSEMVLGRLAALGAIGAHAQSLEESPEAGNGLCWYNSDRSYDRCCRQRDPDCWVGIWVTADLCCYNITQQQQECFDSMEMRVESKLRRLHDMAEMAEEEGLMEQAYMSRVQASSYEILLSQPLSMWSWACSVPDSPFLWSPDCACCEPEEGHCKRPDELFVQKAFLSCCYSVYARRTFEEPEEALEAQIQRHLEPLRPSRAAIQRLGPTLSWHLGGASRAHGCVISIHPNGSITTCPEEVACHGFDCSFLRAVVLALEVIQAIHPLPPLDFVLNAGDETLENTLLEAPVFTRGGTWWTHTLTLPFEWQMHPTQCVRTIKVGMNAMGLIKWEDRKPILIWRGSHSNLWTPHCKIYRAAREFHMLERCVTSLPPHGSPREPIWNFSTWLQMPRGRLIMLSRFVDFVDAKLVDSKLVPMSPDLESFLREEQLYGERIEAEALAQYKYHIAIEGNCAADRVCWQPFLGSVLLLPDGPWQQLPTVRTMEPWVHYVPVLYDLSDLVDKLLWLRAHDAEAKQIALNAVAFAHRHLTCDGNIYYLDRLFRAYAAKLVP
ncbi:unnamed protein product [Durusdinium trenchii]|uniref:Glycosyl transferase CAP10 domain-containing protein n=1 Tax=Durusdinium trenchii TaxID=1381693 RepID=A0ABP0PTN8_9DINO